MGKEAQTIGTFLGHAVIADIDNNEVRLPKSSTDDDAVLPVIALRPGDKVILGKELTGFTDQQRTKVEASADLIEGIPNKALEQYLTANIGDGLSVGFTPFAAAAIYGVSGHFLSTRLGTEGDQLGIVRVRQRPLLALMMTPRSEMTEPDVLAHELTHVGQRLARPVDIFRSQRQADMTSLRDELEAYQTGAMTQSLLENIDPESHDPNNMQLRVDAVRRQHGSGFGLDPLMPTPALLAKFGELGMGHILHEQFDYEAQFAALKNQFETE